MTPIASWLLCWMTLISISPANVFHARDAVRKMRSQRLRSMSEFAEQEIILPNGPFRDRRLRFDRQPKTRLWFEAVDSGRFNRFVYLAPVQSGKTLDACVIPTMYGLFELGETVIFGVPTMDTAADKFRDDLLPVIEASRYRKFLPKSGAGARGATRLESVTFTHGATLKFMSGRGRDEKRSAFTSRIVVITEADKFDASTEASDETDPITQLERRTAAFGSNAMVFLECTVSNPRGRIWQEYNGGRDFDDSVPEDAIFSTESTVMLRCQLCRAWVAPDRQHVIGWEKCTNVIDARDSGRIHCPTCGKPWTEQQRRAAVADSKLVHRGQTIDAKGRIHGDPPKTLTLGFRYNCVANLFVDTADIAGAEWAAKQKAAGADEDAGEKDMRQFWWTTPFEPASLDITPLDSRTLCKRYQGALRKGQLPPDTEQLGMGIDLGKRVGWWMLMAGRANKQVHVVDYGSFLIWSENINIDPHLRLAGVLREDVRRLVEMGWSQADGQLAFPGRVFVDSGYEGEIVMHFARDANGGKDGLYMPILGRGSTQDRKYLYSAPKRRNTDVRAIGNNWHVVREHKHRVFRTIVNADYWKSWVHARLTTPLNQPGAMTLYEGRDGDKEHIALIKHLTAEKQIETFEAGRGTVIRWEALSRTNHWLDCAAYASAALNYSGWKLVTETDDTSRTIQRTGWFSK